MLRMDRLLIALGSAAVVLAIGFGVVHADSQPTGNAPRGMVARGGPAAAAPRPATPASGLLEWATLNAYDYQQGMANLPDSLKALDGKTVTMRGFLLPLFEFDDIKEFILVANHMSCCFGIPAGMNGQVYVKVAGDRGLTNTNEPIEVRGTFHARERTEQGYILSIFEIVDATARVVGY